MTTLLFSALSSCGRKIDVSTEHILEDERSWTERQSKIYKDPDNPNHTIIEDEYGKTVLGPNGEILAQTLDDKAPTSPVYQVEPEQEPELAEQVSIEESSLQEEPFWQRFIEASPHGEVTQTNLCDDYPSQKDVMEFGHAIEKLGGKFIDPSTFSKDLVGFTKYLNEVGITHFSAYEITLPGNKTYAKSCGDEILLPNKGCWLRTAALGLVADKIRGHQERSVKMTSHYRSSCYNLKVGGSKKSDHLSSRAMDIAFGSKTFRKKAQEYICKTFWKDDLVGLKGLALADKDEINISIGLGQSFMHLGLGSTSGRRYWIYDSYKKGENPDDACWTNKL